MSSDSNQIIEQIKKGDKAAFEHVFESYYAPLVNLAIGILKDEMLAEEQVQDVFVKFWEKRAAIKHDLKVFPYLLTSVRNRCYNLTKRQSVEQKYISHAQREYREQIMQYGSEDVTEEMIAKMHATIDELPEKCREVFCLSRFEGKSHKEIAGQLSISTKTVENHISRAMKLLKKNLAHIILIILFLWLGDL